MASFTQTLEVANDLGVCSLAINYTATVVTPHVPPSGPVTSIVASNTGPNGTIVEIWTAAQGSDPNAVLDGSNGWLHTINAPSGTTTLGPGTHNQSQFGWWGVTNNSDVLGMFCQPPN